MFHWLRRIILKLMLGSKVTVLIKQKDTDYFQIELADSRRRIKLLDAPVIKITDSRVWVLVHQSSSPDEYARSLLAKKHAQLTDNP